MRARTAALVVFALLVGPLTAATQSPATGDPPSPSTRDWIVAFENLTAAEVLDGDWRGHTVVDVNHALGFAVVRVDDPVTFHASDRFRDNVRYVEHDDPVAFSPLLEPDDPRYDNQYALPQIRAPTAWETTLGDAGVLVGVVDTGIDQDHEDLKGVVAAQRDVAEDDDTADDPCGHGTHVAGTVAARTDNGVGVAGTAQVQLIVAKAISNPLIIRCSGSASDVAEAITWSTDQGADVISMSIGSDDPSATVEEAVEYAWEKGVLLVSSAGNDGPCSDCISYPAAYPEVVAVTCTDDQEAQCRFSSQGPQAELAAPGDDILSTDNDGGYTERSGTSMSAPHVSGVAALALSVHPNLTHQQLRSLLNDTAQDLGDAGHDDVFGHGETDAAAAVEAALNASGANLPPDATFTSACTELNCTFDASNASDPDGTITAYDWSLGDGTNATGVTVEHTYPDQGSYTVELTVTDDANATDQVTQDVTVSADGTVPLLVEDFDDGTADGWTTSGLWHVSDACATPPSTPNYIAYNKDGTCTYDTGASNSGSAVFDVDLSDVSSANLTFQHRWKTESTSCGLLGCSEFDRMSVEISPEGSDGWTTIDAWSGLDDNQPEWTPASYALDAWTGQPVSLRFVFDTRDSVENDHEGWFVDGVVVE